MRCEILQQIIASSGSSNTVMRQRAKRFTACLHPVLSLPQNLDAVSHALDLALQPAITAWYTTQFAGDMTARLGTRPLTLLQVWSEDDFIRIQENLIGHLVMKRRLKQSPTLFIATTDSELEVVSLCNLRGEVILEQLGTNKREILSEDVPSFLNALQPDVSL